MCGRFTGAFSFREIKLHWNLENDLSFGPRYNIAPSQEVPVILRDHNRNAAKLMKWGLVPSWLPDPSIGQRMINARAETLLEKSSFKGLVGSRRCVIPADGFYEWRHEGNRKVPVWIHLRNRKPFVFAGLWDCWRDRHTGKELYSFTIITCEPNALLRPLHDRMPVIYDREMGQRWLGRRIDMRPRMLLGLLGPYPSELMEARDVSTLVNSPENDSAACIQPVAPSPSRKAQLPLL